MATSCEFVSKHTAAAQNAFPIVLRPSVLHLPKRCRCSPDDPVRPLTTTDSLHQSKHILETLINPTSIAPTPIPNPVAAHACILPLASNTASRPRTWRPTNRQTRTRYVRRQLVQRLDILVGHVEEPLEDARHLMLQSLPIVGVVHRARSKTAGRRCVACGDRWWLQTLASCNGRRSACRRPAVNAIQR
jgi:hypothetical protein